MPKSRPCLEESGCVEHDFVVISCPPSPSIDVLCLNELFDSGNELSEPIAFRCPPLNESQFRSFFDAAGRLVAEHDFKTTVFRGGCENIIRNEVWLYLFSFYPSSSTSLEKGEIFRNKSAYYTAVKNRWLNFLAENYAEFDINQADNCIIENKPAYDSFVNTSSRISNNANIKDRDCIEAEIVARRLEIKRENLVDSLRYIAKDVPRTDRSHNYFTNSAHVLELRDALLTFCVLNPEIGYVQGMNDLMARFLIVLQSEALAFFCFHNYVQNIRDEFSSSGMVRKIGLMASLLKRLDVELHKFLSNRKLEDLFFCQKWLLLCFQREFHFEDGLRLLEILSTRQIGSTSPLGLKIVDDCRKERQDLDVGVQCEMTYHEYSFDLFIAVAILTLSRSEILKPDNDDSDVLQAILRSPSTLRLDDVLNEAETLYYLYCRNSVLYSF